MSERIVIGIGEFAVTTNAQAEIVTHALGSCVAVCLWDPVSHVAGMLHFLLPEAQLNLERANPKLRLEAQQGLAVDIPSSAELPSRHEAPVLSGRP